MELEGEPDGSGLLLLGIVDFVGKTVDLVFSAGIGASQLTIPKARKAMITAMILAVSQIDGVSDDDVAVLVGGGHASASEAFVPEAFVSKIYINSWSRAVFQRTTDERLSPSR